MPRAVAPIVEEESAPIEPATTSSPTEDAGSPEPEMMMSTLEEGSTMSENPAVPASGADLTKVGVALTGKAAIVEVDTSITLPTTTQFAADELTLPAGFRGLGLRTTDGAPEWTDEPDGDALEFFEDGYLVPSGLVTSTCTMILAQTEPLVIELKTGVTLTDGVGNLDLGGNAKRYYLYTEEVYKTAGADLLVERRLAEVTVQSVVAQKPERGTVRGWTVTFANHRSEKFGGTHMMYAQITAATV